MIEYQNLTIFNGTKHDVTIIGNHSDFKINRKNHWYYQGNFPATTRLIIPQDSPLNAVAGQPVFGDNEHCFGLPMESAWNTQYTQIPNGADIVICSRFYAEIVCRQISYSFSLDRLFIVEAVKNNSSKPIGAAFLKKFTLPFRPSQYLTQMGQFLYTYYYTMPNLNNGIDLAYHLTNPLQAGISMAALLLSLKRYQNDGSELNQLHILQDYCQEVMKNRQLAQQNQLRISTGRSTGRKLFSTLRV